MSTPLESKLPAVGTTIFTVMSKLAADCGAINLSQGFPDFDGPARLRELVTEHLNAGRNQYAPMPGALPLREEVARKNERLYGRPLDPDGEITVTAGGTEALFCAVQTVVRPGDEVIVLEPCYDSYEPSVTLAGGRTVRVPLARPDFQVDWQRVGDAVTGRTRLLIVNTPHNPSGAAWSAQDLAQCSALAQRHGLYVLSDEVYEHILFDGRQHMSMLRDEALAARSFVVSSFGKTYHTTGWKVGYCAAPAALTREFRKVHQFVQFSVVTPVQHAIADFLRECPEHYLELPAFYQQRRDRFAALLGKTRLRFRPSAGTYFQSADYSGLSDMPDVQYAEQLTRTIGVASIPFSVFSAVNPPGERLIRFCFAKDDATLVAAAERLARL
ncbi:MAG: pyridoxal phosphate-dependent aminotransferase [Steroidobacterales bacterium]